VNGRNSDNTFIQKYLKWEPNTFLRIGLEKTYRWIYDQYLAREKGKAGAVREAAATRRWILERIEDYSMLQAIPWFAAAAGRCSLIIRRRGAEILSLNIV
jgi:hypothetical protein